MNVFWLLTAQERLRAELHGKQEGLAEWLPRLNAVLAEVFSGQVVLVRDRYSGYREFEGLVILFVEIQPIAAGSQGRFPSPGTYIVKIALAEKREVLKKEIESWNRSRPSYFQNDNVFVSLVAFPNADEPAALVYGDANAVLGQRNILSLEEAIAQACRFGVPEPRSVERIMRVLFERLNSLFFQHSHLEDAAVYLESNRPSLCELLQRYDEATPPSADPKYKHDDDVRPIRRETLAILAAHHEVFADPIDLLRGLKSASTGPPVLRATSHGDLHGRNVQVAMVDDEVSQCAVFDYESFSTSNFVAWDFIKLEVETAVRLLDRFGVRDMPVYAEECMRFWQRIGQRAEAADPHSDKTKASSSSAGFIEWRRLEDLLVSLRVMAHKYLGPNRNRAFDWAAEYELLLAWYAARAAMYPNYTSRWRVAALIAGGVAARRLIRRMPAEVELSHRRRFIAAKDLARGINTVTQGAEALNPLACEFPHVLEIQEELALAHIKLGQFPEAEAILNRIANRYNSQHTTTESKSLLGSLWKRRATKVAPFDRYALEESLKWYRRAADDHRHDEFYPRINVAALLLMLGKLTQAREEAVKVLELIEALESRDFWGIASRGEALLLKGDDILAALEEYHHAINDRDCHPQDRKSMRDQILLLRPHLLEPVRSHLTDAALGDLFQIPLETKL